MSKWVGIYHWSALGVPRPEIFLFDSVAVIGLERFYAFHRRALQGNPSLADDMLRFEEVGAIEDINPPQYRSVLETMVDSGIQSDRIWSASSLFGYSDAIWKVMESGGGLKKSTSSPEWSRTFGMMQEADARTASVMTRCAATEMRQSFGNSAVSLLNPPETLFADRPDAVNKSFEGKHPSVVRVVLKRIPVLDESIPPRDFIDFRNDSDTKERLLALRCWINDISHQDISAGEIEDKLDYLLHSYEQHMQRAKLKYSVGTLEAVVTAGLEVLENLVRFRFSSAMKALFSIEKRELELLDAEAKAPGREISYIVKCQEFDTESK